LELETLVAANTISTVSAVSFVCIHGIVLHFYVTVTSNTKQDIWGMVNSAIKCLLIAELTNLLISREISIGILYLTIPNYWHGEFQEDSLFGHAKLRKKE
jgi:hypothetical protein